MKRNGFTLIELMIVITMVAVMIAMLLPAANKARDVARQLACASNEKGVGFIAHNFAAANREYFPRGYIHQAGNPMPRMIEATPQSHPSGLTPPGPSPSAEQYWKAYGTDLPTWEAYGMPRVALPPNVVSPASVAVPDSRRMLFKCPGFAGDIRLSSLMPTYGNFLTIHYLYLGGYPWGNANPVSTIFSQPDTMGVSNNTVVSTTRKPVNRTIDQDVTTRIMALDMVESSTGPDGFSSHGVVRTGTSFTVNYVNVLWGDGHAGSGASTLFNAPLTAANASMRHWIGGTYFYWGQ